MTTLLALGGVLLSALAVGFSGVLGDEFRGWITSWTRTLARKGAALLPAEHAERGDDWLADVEGEIHDASYRPLWLLVQNLGWVASARAIRRHHAIGPRSSSDQERFYDLLRQYVVVAGETAAALLPLIVIQFAIPWDMVWLRAFSFAVCFAFFVVVIHRRQVVSRLIDVLRGVHDLRPGGE